MILIPQRLFGNKQVTTLLRDGNNCILKKQLHEPVVNREVWAIAEAVYAFEKGAGVILL
jgi:hypothetical protein